MNNKKLKADIELATELDSLLTSFEAVLSVDGARARSRRRVLSAYRRLREVTVEHAQYLQETLGELLWQGLRLQATDKAIEAIASDEAIEVAIAEDEEEEEVAA